MMVSPINYITALMSFIVTIGAILQFYIAHVLCIICNNKKKPAHTPCKKYDI